MASLHGTKLPTVHYDKPIRNDTAVILVFFNVASSLRIQQNVVYVHNQLIRSSIPTFIGEMTFHDELSFFEESDSIFLFRSNSYMFYKENLINLVLQKPALKSFTKYVILDADIVFENPNWVNSVSDALEHRDIVQPFEYACLLSKEFTVTEIRQSICKPNIRPSGHPGYAWAFRRDWYESSGGLFEYALTGGGDTCLVYMAGIREYVQDIHKTENIRRQLQTRYEYIPGVIYHLPHGSMRNRQYNTRFVDIKTVLSQYKKGKMSEAVVKREDGVLEWNASCRDAMNHTIMQYFKKREDDIMD